MPRSLGALLLALAICPAAHAGPPSDHVPPDAILYWGWDGTDAMQSPFAATGVGKVCAEPAIARLCATAWARLRSELRPPIAEALEKLTLAGRYPGSVSLMGVAMEEGSGPVPQFAFQVECGDAGAELHQTIEQLREVFGVEASAPLESGTTKLARMVPPRSSFPIVYGQLGDSYVICTGDRAAQRLIGQRMEGAVGLSTNPRFAAGAALVDKKAVVQHLFIDIAGAIQQLKSLAASAGETLPGAVTSILDSDEVRSLQELTWAMAIDGEGFRRVLHVGVEGGVTPAPPVNDKDLLAVPRNCEFFALTHSNLTVWYGLLQSFLGTAAPDIADMLFGAATDFEEAAGVRIAKDLLEPMGTQFLMYSEPGRSGLFSYSFSLILKPTDPAKLDRSLRKLASFVGNRMAAEIPGAQAVVHAIDANGSNVTQMTLQGVPMGISPSWAVHGEHMIIGSSSLDVLEPLARLQRNDPANSVVSNPDFQARRLQLPPGSYGVTYVDMKATSCAMYPWLVYALQAGLSYFGSNDPSLSGALLPPPYRVHRHFFGDVTQEYANAQGYTALGHGPLPMALPASTATVMPILLGVGAGLAYWAGAAAPMREPALVERGMHDTAVLEQAAEMYYLDHSRYPPDLHALTPDYIRSPEITSRLSSAYRPASGGRPDALLVYETVPAADGMVSMVICGSDQPPKRVPMSEVMQIIESWRTAAEKE